MLPSSLSEVRIAVAPKPNEDIERMLQTNIPHSQRYKNNDKILANVQKLKLFQNSTVYKKDNTL